MNDPQKNDSIDNKLHDIRRWRDGNGHVWTPVTPWSTRFINDTTQQEWDWDLIARVHRPLTRVPFDGR